VPALAKGCQKVAPAGVDLLQINDQLRQSASCARRQRVAPEDPAGADRSADVCRLDQVLLHEWVGIVNGGNRHAGCPVFGQVAGLRQHEDPAGQNLHLLRLDAFEVERRQQKNGTVRDDISLVERII
jgi:hypothetical protein